MDSIHTAIGVIGEPEQTSTTSGTPDGAASSTTFRVFGVYALILLAYSWADAGLAANIYSALGSLAFLPLNLGGAYWLYRASANPIHDRREQLGLRLLAVMYVCTAVGNISYASDLTFSNVDPRYFSTNLFYLAAYFVGIGAMSRFPLPPTGTLELRKFLLDLACVVISMGVVIWTFIVAPTDWQDTDRVRLAINLVYPVASIVMLAMLSRFLMRQAASDPHRELEIITAAIFMQCAIDLILELDSRNTVPALTTWAAAISPLLYVVIVYGAERLARRTRTGPSVSRDPSLNPTTLLPAIAAISVYAVLIWAAQSDRRAPLGLLISTAILLNILFLVKQSISTRENAVLVRQRADAESSARYEALAREGQKLEAVGRLAAGIAHDFNNLLTTVLANSDLALTRLKPGDAAHDELSDIQGAAVRAADLVRQLLAFSRKSVIAPVHLEPAPVLRDMERLLQRLAGEHCQLLMSMASDLGTVQADRGQLEQAIANLVTNARDAMPGGGVIVVGGQNIALDVEAAATLDVPPGDYVALTVQDSGTGIAANVRSQIFEPFFTTKPRGKGTGLGLASTYGIMRQGHGAVGVETVVGKGTRFTLYLPRQAALPEPRLSSRPIADVASTSPVAHGETVLLVEDEASVRDVTRRILETDGYTVLTAANAEAARAMMSSHGENIALLITDVIMPGDTGVVLANDVRERWPDVAVLFISGYSDSDFPGTAGVPADQFLQKPFSGSQLLARVAARLRTRRPAPTAVHSR